MYTYFATPSVLGHSTHPLLEKPIEDVAVPDVGGETVNAPRNVDVAAISPPKPDVPPLVILSVLVGLSMIESVCAPAPSVSPESINSLANTPLSPTVPKEKAPDTVDEAADTLSLDKSKLLVLPNNKSLD